MGAFKSAVITKKGNALLAKVIAGSVKLEFTKIAVSADILSGDLASKTGIGTIKQVQKVASVVKQNEANVKVSTSFSNTGLTAGYYVRNIGLYAMDPTEGEILYSITVADESTATADWMPPFNGVSMSSLMVDIITAVSNASSVKVEVDPTASATVSQINILQSQIDDVKTFVGYDEDNVYGVEVDFSSKTIARIAGAENLLKGADFDALAPWGGRKRCIITDGGVRLAYYGEKGYTESGKLTEEITINGTTYPIGTDVQVMVEQPVFYIKAVPVKAKNATSGKGKQYVKARFYISPTPKIGFVAPRAFYDKNGIVQDKIYLSAYEGGLQYANGTYLTVIPNATVVSGNLNNLRLASIAGAKPVSGHQNLLTRDVARTLANNRGDSWQLHNIFAMAVTEWLFMIEYASLDPQRKIGLGVCKLVDDTTCMALVTGATASIGNGSGIPVGGEDGKCSVTYRGEENLWGNIWTWLDGINILAKGVNEVWVAKAGTTPADNTTEGYECLSAHASHSIGYATSFGIDERYPELLIPTDADGVDTFADYAYVDANHDGLWNALLGGMWTSGTVSGFTLSLRASLSLNDRTVGCRLLYVPQSITA